MGSSLSEQLQSSLGSTYRLDRELGGGGMARVFVATETALGRDVVVKVLAPELASALNAERFRREIQLVARLQHPHIVPVLATGAAGEVLYYTMPFVEGESLRKCLAQRGALPIGEAVARLREVAAALAYAHERGIVHRDVKPDNVLLSNGIAVVTDFGIAKALSSAAGLERPVGMSTAGLTALGTAIGTPTYMAPEQAAGDPSTDHRADLYAWGCMAYELLVGEPPFAKLPIPQLLAAHLSQPPVPVAARRPDVPPALAALVMRCLEKLPGARPQHASEVVAALEALGATPASGGVPAAHWTRVSFARAFLLYVAAFVMVGVLAKAAVTAFALPDWIFSGALLVMALGLPVMVLTAIVQHAPLRKHDTATPPAGTLAGTAVRLQAAARPHLHWSRTARGGAWALGAFTVAATLLLVLGRAGVGPAASLQAAGVLDQADRVVLTDFRGGPDSTLATLFTEAFRTELSQSRLLRVIPSSQVRAALGRMSRGDAARIDLALAREVAQREGAKAVLDGEISRVGSGYLLTARLVTADSGDVVAALSETAPDADALLRAIERLSRKLREKTGESLRTIRETPPLERVTTASLPALREYAAAWRAIDVSGDRRASIAHLREAVRLDSTFAMAWRKLAVELRNGREAPASIAEATRRAFELRDRLPEAERLYTEAAWHTQAPGYDLDRAVAAYERIVGLDSTDSRALNNLAIVYDDLGRAGDAVATTRRAIAMDSASYAPYFNLPLQLVSAGRVEEARRALDDAWRRHPNAPSATGVTADVLGAAGAWDSLDRAMRTYVRTSRTPEQRRIAAAVLADLLASRGRPGESDRFIAPFLAEDSARGEPQRALFRLIGGGHRLAVLGRSDTAAAALRHAERLWIREDVPVLNRPYIPLARGYAMARRPADSRRLLAEWERLNPDPGARRPSAPFARRVLAEIAIAEGRYADAVRELHVARVTPPLNDQNGDDLELGRAFDLLEQPDSAIHYLERFRRAEGGISPRAQTLYRGAALKRLGELYEARGDLRTAEARYAEFVQYMDRPEPEYQPMAQEVRGRLQALRGRTGG